MASVLVVGDEIVRTVVVRYLERDGFVTLEAADGLRARELVEDARPDLVVLDIMLPGIDGLELCRWIRSSSEVPVIMLTARGEEADRSSGSSSAPTTTSRSRSPPRAVCPCANRSPPGRELAGSGSDAELR